MRENVIIILVFSLLPLYSLSFQTYKDSFYEKRNLYIDLVLDVFMEKKNRVDFCLLIYHVEFFLFVRMLKIMITWREMIHLLSLS